MNSVVVSQKEYDELLRCKKIYDMFTEASSFFISAIDGEYGEDGLPDGVYLSTLKEEHKLTLYKKVPK